MNRRLKNDNHKAKPEVLSIKVIHGYLTIHGLKLVMGYISGLQIRVCIKNYFPHFSTKTYDVGAQKNHLNETVLLSTRNICLN